MDIVNVVEIPDNSVNKKIEKVAKRLSSKYAKKRTINEKRLLKIQTPFEKALTIIGNVLCTLLVVASAWLFFSAFNSRLQNVAPTFMGYSTLRVATGSMVASGFDVDDNIVVRSVDISSRKTGDKIAFYVYNARISQFDINTCEMVHSSDITVRSYPITLSQVIGIQSAPLREAAKAGASMVFHEITDVYTDASGDRWFSTKGSSNPDKDDWFIPGDMVVGIYDDSQFGQTVAHVLNATSRSSVMIMLVIVPLVLMGYIVLMECLKDIEIAKLELEVVEEKRDLTDRLCLKNNVGYHMSKKTKFKVLAQAPLDRKAEYISLLWKDGTAPNSVKKYYLKKSLIMRPMEKKLALHRECEKMYHDHVPVRKIAEHYLKGVEKIEKQESRYKTVFKKMAKKYKKAS